MISVPRNLSTILSINETEIDFSSLSKFLCAVKYSVMERKKTLTSCGTSAMETVYDSRFRFDAFTGETKRYASSTLQ